jgi:hypothetical protein
MAGAAQSRMEELLSAGTQPAEQVLEVRRRRRSRTQRRRIERSPPDGKQSETDEAAHHLEAAVRNISMRNTVRGNMQRRPEQHRTDTRARKQTGGTAGRNVQRNDHPGP